MCAWLGDAVAANGVEWLEGQQLASRCGKEDIHMMVAGGQRKPEDHATLFRVLLMQLVAGDASSARNTMMWTSLPMNVHVERQERRGPDGG